MGIHQISIGAAARGRTGPKVRSDPAGAAATGSAGPGGRSRRAGSGPRPVMASRPGAQDCTALHGRALGGEPWPGSVMLAGPRPDCQPAAAATPRPNIGTTDQADPFQPIASIWPKETESLARAHARPVPTCPAHRVAPPGPAVQRSCLAPVAVRPELPGFRRSASSFANASLASSAACSARPGRSQRPARAPPPRGPARRTG